MTMKTLLELISNDNISCRTQAKIQRSVASLIYQQGTLEFDIKNTIAFTSAPKE
jgi:hypothetical protein